MSTATTHIDNKPSLRGTKQSHSLAPALRFNGFEDSWTKKDFGTIVEKAKAKHDPQKSKEEYPCIEMESIAKESSIILDVFNSKDQLSIKNKFSKGEVLFGKLRPNLKKYVIAPFDGVCSSEIWVLKGKELSNEFLFRLIQTNKFYSSTLVTSGSKMPRADWAYISSSTFPYPSLPEQQKIASFLSAVDKKIQQLTKKKALLEDYKKGVMQQLFSSTGSVHRSGKLRFKDDTSTSLGAGNGNAYPDWEEKRLGDVGKTFNGLTGKTKDDFGVGVPYIQYMQIFRSSRINPNEFGFVQLNKDEKQNKVKFGDAFFTTSSETPKEIGTASVLLDEIEDLYLNSFCFGYRPNNIKLLIPQFSQFLLRSEVFRRKIIPLAQGSTRYNMSKVELMKLKVDIPCNEEQQKIAAYLSSIDTKIEAVKSQITQTQIFKKGLLQQLFV